MVFILELSFNNAKMGKTLLLNLIKITKRGKVSLTKILNPPKLCYQTIHKFNSQ